MKFQFPLQKVLQHRKVQEDLAQKNFLEAQAILNSHEEKLKAMFEEIATARSATHAHHRDGSPVSRVQQIDEFLKGQALRIERQKEKISEQEKLVESLREILRKTAVDRKIMESLRDRKQDEFRIEQRKKEQKLVDDLNVMRFRPEKDAQGKG